MYLGDYLLVLSTGEAGEDTYRIKQQNISRKAKMNNSRLTKALEIYAERYDTVDSRGN